MIINTEDSFHSHFKICTFNLLNYQAPPNAFYEIDNIYSNLQWQRKEAWIIKALLDLDPDIIGFQEVFCVESLKTLVAGLGYHFFETVSEPSSQGDHVFEKPVLAIASRFPILSADAVDVCPASVDDLGLKPEFSFSRLPIRAEIQVAGFGSILVYVLHLKSKRSSIEREAAKNDQLFSEISTKVLSSVHGRWASTIQRGTEAALVYQDMLDQMHLRERPVIVMGDLNDSSESPAIEPLFGARNMDKLAHQYVSGMDIPSKRAVQRFSLYDAFDLQENPEVEKRQPTHYFLNRGSVLDYILVSKDFNSAYDRSLARVSNYQVYDRHLINPHPEGDAQCSDHAVVMAEFEIRM